MDYAMDNRPLQKQRILILGMNGQIGQALTQVASQVPGISIQALTRQQCDLAQVTKLQDILEQYAPFHVLINAAAYTQVDKAEEEPEKALQVNAQAPAALAQYCAEKKIRFVHYSTDYVFSGEGTRAWHEDDRPEPVNTYGRSKWLGEESIREIGGEWIILRTSWVYDEVGKNFVNTMLRLGTQQETLRIVNDQYGAPTYARHIALRTYDILVKAREMKAFPYGIYHLCNQGVTSWFDFAITIFTEAKKYSDTFRVREFIPLPTEAYPTPARRPKNSRLHMGKVAQIFHMTMPEWREGLQECLRRKYGNI